MALAKLLPRPKEGIKHPSVPEKLHEKAGANPAAAAMEFEFAPFSFVRALSETLVREKSAYNCRLGLKTWTQFPPQLMAGIASLFKNPGKLPLGVRVTLSI